MKFDGDSTRKRNIRIKRVYLPRTDGSVEGEEMGQLLALSAGNNPLLPQQTARARALLRVTDVRWRAAAEATC